MTHPIRLPCLSYYLRITYAIQGMLNSIIGRDVNAPLGHPEEIASAPSGFDMEELIRMAKSNSPEIRSREKMMQAAEAKVKMAEKDYYPDFTVNAGYITRGGGQFMDMWSLTTTINLPIFYRTKQRQAVLEAQAQLAEAKRELEAAKLMVASGVRDSHSMYRTAEKLMDIYKKGLIPKTYQDFESALAGYTTGRTEAITVINRLKALIDLETLHWTQVAEREKAAARFEAMAGVMDLGSKGK